MKIKLTIDRIEGAKAILKTENNEDIIWPKEKLPEDAKEGAILDFAIQSKKEKEESQKKQAKDILNEILDVNDE